MSLERPEFLQHLAAHESAHAVVGLAHGFTVITADITMEPTKHPDGGFMMGGVVFDAPDEDMNKLAKERPDDAGVVFMAGMCAEEALLGSHVQECWAGDLRIVRIGHGWLEADGRAERMPALIEFLNRAYEEVVVRKEALRNLANVLLLRGKLSGADIAAILAASA